jgi:two-component system CheB/CheR fusion protein
VDRADATVRRVIERYAPPYVVVNGQNDVVRASGRTGKYLELAEGAPSTTVTDMARRGLRSAVRSVLDAARSSKKRSIKRDVRIDTDDDARLFVDVIADPLNDEETLLVFQDVSSRQDDDGGGDTDVEAYSNEDRITQLEDELDETRSKLRTTVEELETSNEELKSSNEEMMSMNEELQSTNEELATVNEELKNKVDQLARANSDLQNFIESTQVPTIFLDRKMRIRSFTPATLSLFRFQDQDKGRLFSDVVSRTDHRQLEELGHRVLETGEVIEQELSIEDGEESHVLRVLPYRDLNDAIDGVIFVFSDVTNIRKAQADLARNEGLARQRSHEIETLYKTAPVGLALVDRNRRYLKVNQHFAELNGQPIENHIGRTLHEMLPSLSDRMERPIAEVFDQATAVTNLEASVRLDGETVRDFLIDFYPYHEDGVVTAVGIVLKDVTEIRRLEKDLRRLMDELQHRVKNTLATVASIVTQTVASKSDPIQLVDTLKMRIGALAATHNLLTLRNWRDVSLQEILNAELKPFDHEDRVKTNGPPVLLPPKPALTMTLTLHELATNAAKYGALAHEDANLEIDWIVSVDSEGRELTLNWRESGVPVPAGKVKESFGTRFIKNAVVHDLQGHCEHRLEPDGVRCTIRFPF